MKKNYNAAVIGCGRIGSILEQDKLRPHPCTHAGAYYAHPKINLVAGCDIDKERLDLFKKAWSIQNENLYVDYNDLLKRNDIDILSIATDTEFHYEIIANAVKNQNIKIILLEKPVVATLKEAVNLENIAKKVKTKIIINHERRFNQQYIMVKDYIIKKKYGELKSITGNVLTRGIKEDWHSDWRKSGGGTLLHDGTHLIDIMLYFAGELDYLTGDISFSTNSKYCVENYSSAMLKFKNGVVGFLEASSNREYFNFELDLQFEKGRIQIGNSLLNFFENEVSSRYEGFYDLVKKNNNPVQKKNFFIEVVDDIVESIENDDYFSKSTVYDGLNAFYTIMAVYYSGIKNNKKIYFPFHIKKHPFSMKRCIFTEQAKNGILNKSIADL